MEFHIYHERYYRGEKKYSVVRENRENHHNKQPNQRSAPSARNLEQLATGRDAALAVLGQATAATFSTRGAGPRGGPSRRGNEPGKLRGSQNSSYRESPSGREDVQKTNEQGTGHIRIFDSTS